MINNTQIKELLNAKGVVMNDKRFNRVVQSGNFVTISFDRENIGHYSEQHLLDKYFDDTIRMYEFLEPLAKEHARDRYSRQLLLLNTKDFLRVKPCFLLMQFIIRPDDTYEAIVYQRSLDVAKLEDDIIFFSKVIARFEERTREIVSKLILVCGNAHYEIDKLVDDKQ